MAAVSPSVSDSDSPGGVTARAVALAGRGDRAPGRGFAARGFRAGRGDGRGTLEFHDRCGKRAGAMVVKIDRRVVFVGRGDSAGTVLRLGYTVAY